MPSAAVGQSSPSQNGLALVPLVLGEEVFRQTRFEYAADGRGCAPLCESKVFCWRWASVAYCLPRFGPTRKK